MIHAALRLSVPLALLSAAMPCHAVAQAMGRWIGSLELSSGAEIALHLTASQEARGITATMQAADGPVSPVSDLTWNDDRLSFIWGAFACDLRSSSDGRYIGDCDIDGGGSGTLSLSPPAGGGNPESELSSGRDILTTDDLLETGMLNVYEAIERLRPRWLRPRGAGRVLGTLAVDVYLDGQIIGTVDVLNTIQPDDIRDVQYFSASDATFRFGRENGGGALALRRRR